MNDLRVLFVARGTARTAWYRIVLPAMHMEQHWAALHGEPPHVIVAASLLGGDVSSCEQPELRSYDVVVMQQPSGMSWFKVIRKLRGLGVTVLYEIDDDLHAVHKANDHEFTSYYDKENLKRYELCMRACDGMICSTGALAERYARFARRSWVCENGLDMQRYALTRPPRGSVGDREAITLMWSGATGHRLAADPWLQIIAEVMEAHPEVCFASIGQNFTDVLRDRFPGRTIAVPFCALESYPAAMMIGDIALAPAGRSDWYKAKSQLRAMEAAALGIPVVADTHYRPSVVEGETGYVVNSPVQVRGRIERLLKDPQRRHQMGAAAKAHAEERFAMARRVGQWNTAVHEARELTVQKEAAVA